VSEAHVRAELRALTRRMVEGAPYDELTRALDALAAVPGADAAEIAGRRLALLSVYHRNARERDRVLRAALPNLTALPVRARARWVLGVCVGHLGLAEGYLPTTAAELDTAGETGEAARLRERLQHERDTARPRRKQRRSAAEESAVTFPPHIKAGLEVVRWLHVGRRTYREINEALDAILDLPGSAVAAPRVATERLIALVVHEQGDDEVERVLVEVAPVLATFPARDRALGVARACAGRPALAERYLPAAIAALEGELQQRPDAAGEAALDSVRRIYARTAEATASDPDPES
jgi:hypothetical protein